MHKYDKDAVNSAIASSNRSGQQISRREAKQIHRVLSGRDRSRPQPKIARKIPGEGPGGEAAMSADRFVAGIEALGFNVSTAHRLLGIGRSTAYRMSKGTAEVPGVVMRLMDMYERFGIPKEHQS